MRTAPPRVTYGPDYGPRTEWENLVLLECLRASQGRLDAHVRGVAVEAGYELVVVHACVDREDAATVEDLAELATDTEASLEQYVEPPPTVQLRLHEGDTDRSWPGYEHRRVYLAHCRARGNTSSERR
ncbi:hypothetical protein [Pimelobacter simplex]|uniref:hypothetical protein n=1 Tax=Nocardioides simplex TaxID=2045 RepID=UPI0019315DB4|nr:hypothetical protein [Pimelobacter simplex]